MYPKDNQVGQPEAYRVADTGRDALVREGYDGRIPRATPLQSPEEMGKQARDITLNAYKTEKEHGFEFAVPEYKRAIELADRVDQKAVRDELAALKNRPPEGPGHATRQGRVSMVAKEDMLNGAINAPVTTRVNYALACLRNGRPEDVVEAQKTLDRAVQLKPELRTNQQLMKAIEYADKQGQARRASNVEKTDPYSEYGGTGSDSKPQPKVEDPYSLYGDTLRDKKGVNDAAVIDKRPFIDRTDLLVPPPPDFAPFYGILRDQDAPKPKPPTDQPKPPVVKPPVDQPKPPVDQPKPPVDQPKPPVDQPKPPSDQPKPPSGGQSGSDRDGARERKDNSDLLKYIAAAAAAAGGIYGAYRALNNYLKRQDDVNKATDKARVRIEPERDPARPETEIRKRETRELLDKTTWDPKTQTFADKEGKRVPIKDVDIEFKFGIPAGVDAAKYQEEQRARMKGQLDLELRGQKNMAGLLNDVKVVADEKATAGSTKIVLKQGDGKEGEVVRRTQDGKLEVKRADGKVETVDVQPTDKVEVRVGGKDGAKSYSERDAIADVAYKLGRQSDIEFAKMLADHGGNITHNQLAKRFEDAAKTATGDMKKYLEDQAKEMRKQGDAPIDRSMRATIADTLRAEAAKQTGPLADQLRTSADIIMPQEVATEVKRQVAAEKAAAEKVAAEKAAAEKAAAEKAAAEKAAAEKAAADKAAEEKAAAEKAAAEKAAADKAAEEKAAAEKAAAEKAAADKAVEEKAAAEKAAAEKAAAEKAAADKAAEEKAAADKAAAEKAAGDKAVEEKAAAEKAAAEKAAADKAAEEKAAADKAAAEKAAADKAAAEKAAADKAAAEKAAADKAAAEKAAADKAAEEKAAAEKAAAEKAAADKAAEEKAAAEKAAADKAAADKAAEEKAAAEKAAAEKAAAEKAAAEKAAAEKAAAEKAAAEKAAAEKAAAEKAAAEKAAAEKAAAEKAAAEKAAAEKAAAEKAAAEKAAAEKAAAEKAAADKAAEGAGGKPGGGTEGGGDAKPEEGTTRRRRKPGELGRTETSVNGDGSITRVDGEVGSLAEIAKRGKLYKPEIRGMEAALAQMEEEQRKNPSEERANQIKETKELVDRLNGVHGEAARAEAHRSVAESCRRQLDLRAKAGAAGGTLLSIGVIAVFAMQMIRDNKDSGSPYQRPGVHSGS